MIAAAFSEKIKEVTIGISEDKTLVRTCLNIQKLSQQIYIFLNEKLHESSSLFFCYIFNQGGLKLFKSEKKSQNTKDNRSQVTFPTSGRKQPQHPCLERLLIPQSPQSTRSPET